jgi:cell division protein FtsB
MMASHGHAAGRASSTIRWDRVGRLALLFVFIGVAALYIGPSISYLQTRSESSRRHEEISVLKKENVELKRRREALRSDRAVENEARRQGMVKPGERAYVVKGLPDN